MTFTPNGPGQALLAAMHEHDHPSQNWKAYCQKFCRKVYEVPPLFSSAYTQWLGADPEDKHVGGHPDAAPVGALLCYKGSGKYGHIMVAANPFKSGTAGAWSNDLVRTGKIDKVSRTAPTTHWNQKYLGYLTAINHYDIAKLKAKPKPKQRPYAAIYTSIEHMENALATAIRQHDVADQKVLRAEIARLKDLHTKLRRNV
jgi:hypothetical protein